MKILILAAGDATRFANSQYKEIKPLVEIKGKRIVKWTTDSLPFTEKSSLYFAIRSDQDKVFHIKQKLKNTYNGQDINFFEFNSLTRGNLETCFFSVNNFEDENEELLVLDSDNKYNGCEFKEFLNKIKEKHKEFATICYFNPFNRDAKWCFAFPSGDRIIKLSEKDSLSLDFGGYPMVGTFYFSSIKLFRNSANFILSDGNKVKNEFFMSQSIDYLINNDVPVFGLKVDNVSPLGTPSDVEIFEKL